MCGLYEISHSRLLPSAYNVCYSFDMKPQSNPDRHPALGCLAGSLVHMFIYNLLIFIVPVLMFMVITSKIPPLMNIGHHYTITILCLIGDIFAGFVGGYVFSKVTGRPAKIYWLIITFVIYFFLFPYTFDTFRFTKVGIGNRVMVNYTPPISFDFLMRFAFMGGAMIAAFFGSRWRNIRGN
jgi:hypothetical protein